MTMIWISFLSNILILGTALFLLKLHKSQMSSNQFIWFILLTGISSGVAAFGHLPLLEKGLANSLLFVSRILSLWSIYFFTNGSIDFARFHKNKMIRITNSILFLAMILVLVWNNQFLPVMIYGIVGFMGIGLSAYFSDINNVSEPKYYVVRGISVLSFSALVFALFKENYHFLAINISHILVSFSLILFSRGFVGLNLQDEQINSQS